MNIVSIHPLQRTGRLSPDDLSSIQQVQGVLSMLGEKAGILEDLLKGQPQQNAIN